MRVIVTWVNIGSYPISATISEYRLIWNGTAFGSQQNLGSNPSIPTTSNISDIYLGMIKIYGREFVFEQIQVYY